MTSAAMIAAAGAGAFGVTAAHAAASLPLTLTASGAGTYANFSSGGELNLQTGNGATYAKATVGLAALGSDIAPASPPSFTVVQDASTLSPRWVIKLANGNEIDGYSTRIGGTATAGFTGDQWTENGGTTYETYQQALSDAGDAQGTVAVTSAYVYADGIDSPNVTAVIDDIQYDGETADTAPVTVTPVPAQTVTAGAPTAPVQVHAASSGVPSTVIFSATGLPEGLEINSSTGVISGTVALGIVSSTATITVSDAFGDTVTTTVAYTVNQPICSELTGCSWQRFENPSNMVMDVKGRTPRVGAPIIAWTPSLSDPAVDFTADAGPGSSEMIHYTPYGTRATAEKDNPALAAAAYNSNGSAKYCVSAVADQRGQALQLRACATKANQWQDFIAQGNSSNGDVMYEPTYGQAGVSAGSHPMAINDKAYGGDGTPLINYPAIGSGNEEFLLGTE